MSVMRGGVGDKQTSSLETSKTNYSIPVEHGKARLEALCWSPAQVTGTALLAHDERCGEGPLLEDLRKNLQEAGIRVMEICLVRPEESQNRLVRYDIPLLARRLAEVRNWAEQNGLGRQSTVIGTGNAVAAALWLSTKRYSRIRSVVSLGGRPHLAEPALSSVRVPTLLFVDTRDARAQHMNRIAARRLGNICELHELTPQSSQQAVEIVGWVQKQVPKRSVGAAAQRVSYSFPALGLLRSLISLALFFSLSMV